MSTIPVDFANAAPYGSVQLGINSNGAKQMTINITLPSLSPKTWGLLACLVTIVIASACS